MGSVLEKNSTAVRKRIESHAFTDEEGDEYEGSAFGGFPEYFRRKKIKLQNLDSELRTSSAAANKPPLFKGMVIHVSGYTQPPLHVLHKMVVEHGGGFLQYLDSKTMATHIVASALPPKKSVDFARYRIVKPEWITASIEASKLQPWTEYRVIDEGPRQKMISFSSGKMVSQAKEQNNAGYREQTDASYYTSQFKKPQDDTSSPSFGKTNDEEMDFSRVQALSGSSSGNSAEDTLQDMDIEVKDFAILPPAWGSDMPATASNAATVESMPQESAEALDSETMPPPPPVKLLRKDPSEMTSEEHNSVLLSDPHMRKTSSANPDFLKQYYSESRLHHLSAWKAELKSRMQRLANERGPALKSVKRKPGTRRYIMHVDFDSFFCAVSLLKAPDFKDKPAVVAHGNGAGSEIASCNYPARKFGIKNGMWMKKALELCPDLKILPYDFPAYEEASALFYEAILDVGGVVQSVSIDEALMDVTSIVLKAAVSDGHGMSEGSLYREQKKANEIATELRAKIKLVTGCDVSIGIGGNILLAKVALRKGKPAGQFQMVPEQVMDIIGDLKVEDLPGVAWSIGGKLEEIGIKLVKDIRQTSKERLVSALGPKTGEKLWDYSRGIDKTAVGEQSVRKSVSAEVNWGIRFINQPEAEEFVMNLCKELEKRLLNESVKGKQLTMKIMRRSLDAPLDPPKHLGHGKCDTFNKSMIFGVATNNAEVIGKEAVTILRSYKFSPGDLRGLGVQLTKLEPLKSSTSGLDSSQKTLSFAGGRTSKKETIDDDSPLKPRTFDMTGQIADVPLTPKKPRTPHPALTLSKAGEADSKSQTPLNVHGTQFALPSSPDHSKIAQQPPDIRARLMAQGKPDAKNGSRETSPSVHSRDQSPALQDEIPPDIDAEVFEALPDDVKAEVLASYREKKSTSSVVGQSLLAQSPRKNRVIPSKKPPTPSKQRSKGLFNMAKERAHDAEAHLLQTNFLSLIKQKKPDEPIVNEEQRSGTEDDVSSGDDELDPAILAELPEVLRREVIDEHRRQRLARKSGLDFETSHHRRQRQYEDSDEEDDDDEEMELDFPPAPEAVPFNSADIMSERQLKDMVAMWREETRSEGPHAADVDVFVKYLERVVTEERDMAKVRNLVKWLQWDIGEEKSGPGKKAWTAALGNIKAGIQAGVKQRSLAMMRFD